MIQLYQGAVVAVIVYNLPMQSVPITTDMSSNLDQGELYNMVW
jgi:hypothetical protein